MKNILKKSILSLATCLTVSIVMADVTLFDKDFSTLPAKTYSTATFEDGVYFNPKSGKNILIDNTGINFNGQNASGKSHTIGIPVSGVNGSVTITISHDYGTASYKFKLGNSEGLDYTNASPTLSDAFSKKLVETVSNLSKTEYVFWFGEAGSSYKSIKSITITTPDGEVTPGGDTPGGGETPGGDTPGGGDTPTPSGSGSEEIIKVVLSGERAATQTVTGTIGGTSAVKNMGSSSPYKLNSDGAYVSLVLASGSFEATDTLLIDGSKKMQVYYGTAGEGTELLTTEAPNNGVIVTPLTGLPTGQNSIYVYRTSSTYNGTLTYMAVHRPSNGGGDTPSTVAVTDVSLNKTATSIEQGQTETLTATVQPANATNQNISWSSSDESVAKVADGVVTALNAGTATITVTTEDGNKTATCNVTVTAPAAPIEVTGISLKTTTEIAIGGTETLTVTYDPVDANTGKEVTWSSSDETVAKVDANGKVTGLKAGTATITATSKTKSSITASCTVTVKAVPVTGITVTPATATLQINGTTTLSYTVSPSDATDKTVSWSSDNTNVATVDANGKVTGVAEGTATITVTTTDGNKTATCLVTVQAGKPLPETGLTAHTPEIYEDPKGYNTPITKYNNRDYEVYYVTRDPSGNNICIATNTDDKVAGISNGTTTTVKARDNWFELTASDGKGGDGNAAAKDEFKLKSVQSIKMQSDQEMVFQVKGFDQFNFYGNDNNKDASKGKHFQVYIDDELQAGNPGSPIDGYAIHRYDMSSAEHVIRLVAIGASNSKVTGFSLRVSNDPIVRHVGGKKDQTAYQTKDIEPIAFRVRRAASHRLTWVGGKEIPDVSLIATTNDSVFLQGTANAATGTYIYKIEALDASGNVASYEQGTITVETQIFDSEKGNDFSTKVAEPMKPVSFLYYATNSSDITLNCDIEGLTLSFEKDSIAVLSGTPDMNTTEGEHTYSISAAGGNTITGKINIVVPNPYFEPIAEAKVRDGNSISFAIIVHHAEDVTVTGLPNGFTSRYDKASDTLSISGTANTGAPYPQTIPYTMTATPRYNGKATITETGTLVVIDPDAKAVLVVCKGIKKANDDPYCKYLNDQGFDITLREQDVLAGSSYEAFDLLLISETVDANNEEVLKLVRGEVNLPVLNMKGFTYSPGRVSPAGWGEPNNGAVDTLDTKVFGCNIILQRAEHEIFKQLAYPANGKTVKILDTYTKRGVMPIAVNKQGSLCLATAATRGVNYYSEGPLQTAVHEIPASERKGHKYICLPLSANATLSTQGKKLIDGIVEYLLSSTPTAVALPVLRIDRFAVDGIEGKIDQTNNTIELVLEEEDYIAMDSLVSVAPEITIADDSLTHVLPATDTLSMAHCTFIPMVFTVTDYINVRAYTVTARVIRAEGLEEVEAYTAGEWINIYDIYGRKVATTNEDIYTMALPRGVYIIQTSKGNTLKIMK